MDPIPDPDVLWSGTNQGEFPGEEGQKKALRTSTEGNNVEKKAEHGERDNESDSGNRERNSSSDGGREDSKPPERDCGEETGTTERRETEEDLAAVWRRRAAPGDTAGNQEAAQQTLATFWEERGHSRCVGRNVPDSGEGAGEEEITERQGESKQCQLFCWVPVVML
ncbi:hypothetical protein NDU88_000559 [Pleurodeles waltl]|uniref:Uncharacterized protein n=1 Tax=Pleurodeles waltl TaxID=8319 RepID=A0AAV7UTQ8_PLEWA|nr:hypothetical protein NDU88_000559 [Pleurodeles waltl]